MYTEELPEKFFTTTKIKIKYDCCGKEHILKWKDADKNFQKNDGKHICRPCWLHSNKNPAKQQEVKEKIKKTNIEKYGNECPLNTQEEINKRKEALKDDNFFKERNLKRQKTCLEKYGVDHPMKSKDIKEKHKKVFLDKYGVENPLQVEEIKEKVKNTNLEKYGVTCTIHNSEINKKVRATMLERYGVEYYNQLESMKSFLRDNCTDWLADSYKNPWAKGIKRPAEWDEKLRNTISDLIIKGEWNSGYHNSLRGKYPATKCVKMMPRFLSSLELVFHHYLNNSTDVEWYNYEAISIQYNDENGNKHNYIPDFLVKYKNSDRIKVVETKSINFKENSDVLCKQKAAIDYCSENNMDYIILFDEDIINLGFDIEEIKKIDGIIFDAKQTENN